MFEFDPAKSAANRDKHGIDFEEVQALWSDARRPLIGMIGPRHWTVVFTRRDDRLRIISARRARKEEVALYEEGLR
jgi:uncharacterized DUF497 family protein